MFSIFNSCLKIKSEEEEEEKILNRVSLLSAEKINILKFNLNEYEGIKQIPKTIFVIDGSSSMGRYYKLIINEVIPKIMEANNYTDKIDIITFASNVVYETQTIQELKQKSNSSSGCTNMSGIFNYLKRLISRVSENDPINIIVISDGELSDKNLSISEAKKLASEINRSGIVNVVPVRLITSQHSDPDTKGLASVGLLHTLGSVSLLEFEIYKRDISELIQSISSKITVSKYGEISSINPSLRLSPHDKPVKKLSLMSKNSIILINSETNLSDISVTFYDNNADIIENYSLDNINLKDLESEEEIYSLLDMLNSWLKVRMVVGLDDESYRENIKWLKKLSDIINSKSCSDSDEIKLKDRLIKINSSIKKRTCSILNNINQMVNSYCVNNLNSKQQADFLRNDVKNKDTAKRIEKNIKNETLESIVSNNIKYIKYMKVDTSNYPDSSDNISFFSQSGFIDNLLAIRDLEDFENATISEVLQLSGGTGLCFSSYKGDLPNPWDFMPTKVYLRNLYLSETDIRTNREIYLPSTNEVINGVLPIRSFNIQAYDMYNFGNLKSLSELQGGVTLRGIIGLIPYDVLAMNMGVLRKSIIQIGLVQPSSFEKEIIFGLINQIREHFIKYANKSFKPIADFLCLGDPRPFLIGINDANNVSKLLAILIGHTTCQSIRENRIKLQEILLILFDLEAYWCGKKYFNEFSNSESREIALNRLLDINIEDFITRSNVGLPFESDPIFEPFLEVDISESVKRIPQWFPNIDEFTSIFRWITDDMNAEPFASYDIDLLKLWVCVCSIYTRTENDRIDKEKNYVKYPLPFSKNIIKSIQKIINNIYKENFEERIQQKRQLETKLSLEILISKLLDANDESEFVDLLNNGVNRITITNRSSDGYIDLVDRLTNLELSINIRLTKLKILLIGRNSNDEIVWANGNVLRGKYGLFAETFIKLDEKEMWISLEKSYLMNSYHTYRIGNRNRHTHGTEKPSYYAFGFFCLKDFHYACLNNDRGYTLEDWEKYKSIHKGCCGFP